MPRITLPDGSTKSFEASVTGLQVAEAIGPRLAKAALGCKVNGELRDLSTRISADSAVSIVTEKNRDGTPDPDALFLIRHSAAHIMAEAIQRILPGVQLAYGPPLPTGFYYDMAVPPSRPLSSDDFANIEKEMAAIIAENRPFTRYENSTVEGLSRLKAEGNKYKLDNAERAIKAATESGDSNPALSFYATGTPGKNWEDLCRGPHVPSTGRIGAVKVMSLASSFWHGDENSDRLTRVYGIAFATKAELDLHIAQLEEARKRDHRVIGRQQRLFHIDDDVGQGLVLWTPAGSVMRLELMSFIGAELRKQGYQQVFTPHIGRLELYKTSGHFPYYKDAQYPPLMEPDDLAEIASSGCSCAEMCHRLDGVAARLAKGVNERAGRQAIGPDRIMDDDKLLSGYLLRPMNCPHHVKIFASSPHSYRDMPVRLSEFGTVYRWEQSGELNGMTRVRGFTQDDAHLFCMPEQVPAELQGCLSLVKLIFATLSMTQYRVRLGLRSLDSEKYIGSPENWDRAEQACRDAAQTLGVPYSEEAGEAAFYGPKIDFVVKDVIGREWQLGTVQVDYNLPSRFDLSYIGPDNQSHRPVMIHRAPFGSFERFCGVLIEHFAGAFPTWLSPEMVRILPISDKSNDYAAKVLASLNAVSIAGGGTGGLRATMDCSSDRIQAKVKVAADEKVPYMLVVGPRDAEQGTVSVRARGIQKDLGAMKLESFVEALTREVTSRSAAISVGVN